MHVRKTFSYIAATVPEIVAHFHNSTRQAIDSVRKSHANNPEMSSKIAEAYRQYKKEKILAKYADVFTEVA